MSKRSLGERRSASPPRGRAPGLIKAVAFGLIIIMAMVAAVVVAPSAASADPITWSLDGVTGGGGRTLSGTFTYDVDTDTYSNVNITMVENGNNVQFDHAIRADISDASTIIIGQAPQGSDQTGNRIVRIRYVSPLTNAGGVAEVNTASPNSFVGICNDAGCVSGIGINALINGGNVITGQRWFIQGGNTGGATRTVRGSFVYDANSNTYTGVDFIANGFPQSPIVFSESIRPDIDRATVGHFGQLPEGSDQTGSHITRITFQSALTNAGGTIPINVVRPNSFIGECRDTGCVSGIRVFGVYTAGQVTTNPLQAPTITSGSPIQADETVTLVADVQATDDFDSEGSGLTYSLGGTDAALFSINGANGQISFNSPPDFENPRDAGGDNNYDLIVTVTDLDGLTDTLNLQIQIQDINEAPVLTDIADQSVDEGSSLSIPVSASDPDTFDSLTLGASGLPSFCSFTDGGGGSGTINCNPGFGDAGTTTVTVTVTDLGTLQDSDSFDLTVNDVNRAPSVTPIADQGVDEGQSLSVPVSASDPDGDSLTLSAPGLPSFCSLNDAGDGTGTIDCNPGFDDAGSVAISVTASDDGSPAQQDSESFNLTVNNVNRPPGIDSIADQAVDEGQSLSVPVSASDPDGDSLTLNAPGLPSFCSLNDAGDGTGTIDCNPGFDDAGGYAVDVGVDDGGGGPLPSIRFQLTVNNVNRPPVITSIGDQTVDEGQSLSVPVSATDPDGDFVTLVADTSAAFCGFATPGGGGVGTLFCDPGFDDAGVYTVTVTANDGSGDPIPAIQFLITVNNVNRGPVITPIGDQAVDEGQNIGIPVSVTDPDGDNLTLGVVAPAFCAFGTPGDGTGTIACNPGFDDAGIYDVEVAATDDGSPSLGSAIVFQLTVNNVNRNPVLVPIADQTVDEGQTISIPISSSDPDGNGLTLTAALTGFCSLTDAGDGTGSIDCNPGFLDSGTYLFTVVSTDDGSPNLADIKSFMLEVVEINDPPVVEAGPNTEITVPDPAQMAGSATDDGNPVPPGALTYQWTVVSGSGNVIFADDTSPTTSVVFEGGGDFVLRLTASDGQLTGFDEVTITVNNPLGCTIFGTNGPDDLVGTNGPDVICGFAGNDDIDALLGDDTVFGGIGNDKMNGGGGNDTMSSPSGTNTFNGQGGNDNITGGGGPDTVDGGGGADIILGLAGNDILRGGSGRDTITGGSGNDEIRGGGGNDRLRDAAGDDMLFGEGGKDSLRDLVGNNTLDGGPGTDRCTDNTGTFTC